MDGLPQTKHYNKRALEIIKIIKDKEKKDSVKYGSVFRRMSVAELYYYVISILNRDEFNQNKKSNDDIVQKVLNYAKHVCVDKNDAVKINDATKKAGLWDARKPEEINNFINQNGLQIVNTGTLNNLLGQKGLGVGKIILSAGKGNKLINVATNHNARKILLNMRTSALDDHYTRKMQAQKILLSVFARQTKYYGPFMMSMLEGQEPPHKQYPIDNSPLDPNNVLKETARTLFWDLWTSDFLL